MTFFKKILKNVIVSIIRFEAKLVLKKYKPKIVGVAGSVGKTGTKEAVAQVLATKFKVRKSQKSFNHDLGIPLTILGCDNAWWNPFAWLKNMTEGLSLILFRTTYPEWLVLEVGVEHPGDIDWVTDWVKFDVVVMTRLPDVPVHVEYFHSPEQLIKEKLKLPRSVSTDGILVLNYDDPKIMAAKDSFKGRVLTYGWSEGATVRASNEHMLYSELTSTTDGAGTRKLPDGVAFKVDYDGNNVPFRLRSILAFHQIYGALAAITVGVALGINLVDMIEALEYLEPSPGRFRLLAGIKDTVIIDDTYNASPTAMESALHTLAQVEMEGRKIVVLGDMMELGPMAIEAHRQIGLQAAKVADIIFTVGLRMKFAEEELIHKHFAKTRMFHYDDWQGVGEKLQTILKPGDIVLVKGSQSMRLEKVVEEIMAFPEDKESLLVRQELEWKKR